MNVFVCVWLRATCLRTVRGFPVPRRRRLCLYYLASSNTHTDTRTHIMNAATIQRRRRRRRSARRCCRRINQSNWQLAKLTSSRTQFCACVYHLRLVDDDDDDTHTHAHHTLDNKSHTTLMANACARPCARDIASTTECECACV